MYPKRIVCGLESIKERVVFEMHVKVNDGETDKVRNARFEKWRKSPGGKQYLEQYSTVEEFIPWMLDEFERLNSDGANRRKIRAIGCWLTTGEFSSG